MRTLNQNTPVWRLQVITAHLPYAGGRGSARRAK
jgi:hypothetical protein